MKTINILLVEDSQVHIELILHVFQSRGDQFCLTPVDTLAAARELLRTRSFDLLIVDFLLSDGRGTELLPREDAEALYPVIVLTGHGDENLAVQTLKAGAMDYVVKSRAVFTEMPHIALRALRQWERIQQRGKDDADLRESEARFRDLFENAPLAYQTLDAEGCIIRVNQAWIDALQYSKDAALGVWFGAFIVPAHRPRFHDLLESFRGGLPFATSEMEMVRKDGATVLMSFEWRGDFEQGRLTKTHCILTDITERKRAEEATSEERYFLQKVIDGVVDPIQVIGLDYQIRLMNKGAQNIIPLALRRRGNLACYRAFHHLGHPCEHADQPCEDRGHPCLLAIIKETGEAATVVHQRRFTNGETRIFELEASPLWNSDGTLQGIIESSRDITDRLRIKEQLDENRKRLHYLAHHDPLTELPNRLLFNERMDQAMIKADRYVHQVALLFLDLDRFKRINDSLGHEVGDQLLCHVAQLLKGSVRKADTVSRLGGDEFLILLEKVDDINQAAGMAERILEKLNQPLEVGEYTLQISTSIGISLYPGNGRDTESLLKCADLAMYRAKDSGRNTFRFFSSEMSSRAEEFLALDRDLRLALERNELVLVYQPQFDLATGRLMGLEALLRWQHPERGLIPPNDFTPLAEERGLMESIGRWVLATACRQNRRWQEQGLPGVRMAVNVSARQFREVSFVATIDQILAETGLAPEWLELEITEGTLMENAGKAIKVLSDLKERGIALTVDDFGTGYSSLGSLKRLPISRLKIDHAFVKDLATSKDDVATAKAILSLAQNMGMDTIAEGVETEEQLAVLRHLGCPKAQGFLLGRPLAAPEIPALLIAPPLDLHSVTVLPSKKSNG